MNKESFFSDRLTVLVILFSIVVVYFSTFSYVPASDGYAWASFIDQQDWKKMFWPYHLLPEFIIFLVKTGFETFFVPINTVRLIQGVNVFLSAASAVTFYRILRIYLRLEILLSFLGTLLFSFSFSLWYFANGEIHHFGLLFLLLVFAAALRYCEHPSGFLACQIGLLHAMANAMHQEHFLMFVPVALLMFRSSPPQNRIRNFVIYCAAMAGLSLFLFAAIALVFYQAFNIRDFLGFFFMAFTDKSSSATHFSYIAGGDHSFFRMLKGAFLSIHYGSQIFVDYLRDARIRSFPLRTLLFLLTLTGVAAAIFLVARLVNTIPKLKNQEKNVFAGALTWLVTYKVLLNLWHWPGAPEYHLASAPPLLLILLLSLSQFKKQRVAIGLLSILFLSTFSVNLFAGILPWKTHGKMVQNFKSFALEQFQPNDFFISCESSLDPIISERWELFSIKNLFKQTGKREGFQLLEEKIESALQTKRRVFIYNFIPAKFALNSINLHNPNEQFSEKDFEIAFSHLKSKFQVKPIYQYREGAYSQPYFIRQDKDHVWLVSQ